MGFCQRYYQPYGGCIFYRNGNFQRTGFPYPVCFLWRLRHYGHTRQLLLVFVLAAASCIVGAVFLEGMAGLWSLVATSAFMSLMFPTIYGIALEDVGQDTTLGAAGLVMAIGGRINAALSGCHH